MTNFPLHSVSVAGAVLDERGRFLAVQRRDNGHWELPGGVLELDETIEEGLVREVREETGFVVAPDQVTGIYKNVSRGIIALVFRCSIVAGAPIISDETVAIDWLTKDQVKHLMTEAFGIRLLDAIDDGPVHIRHHNGSLLR